MSILNDIMNLATGNRWESDKYPDRFQNKGLRLTSSHTVYLPYARAIKNAAKDQPLRTNPVVRRRDWIALPVSRQKKGNQPMTNKPIDTIRFGGVSASIFKNERKKDGEPFYTATISRAYQDKSGEWKHTNSFSVEDLKKVRHVVDVSLRELEFHREKDRADSRSAPQTQVHVDYDTAIQNAAQHQPAAALQNTPEQGAPGQVNGSPQQSPEQ